MTKKSPAEQAMAKANETLQSFTPTSDFVGYPFGKEHPVHFRAGVASPPVPASWINSLSAKKTEDKPAPKSTETASDKG